MKVDNKCEFCGAPVKPIIIEKPPTPDEAGFEMDVEMFGMYIKKYANRSTGAETDAREFLQKWKIIRR